ncbi:MAG: AMP-binding protein [Candidatus Desulfacyla sp.]
MEKIWMKNWPSGVPMDLNYVHGERPIFSYLSKYAQVHPEKLAIYYYGHEITYGQLDDKTDRFASFLIKSGVRKGDRVALYLQNCPSYVICQLGAHKAGAIVVPCGPMAKAWELEHLLNGTGAETIVCLDELYPNVEEILSKTSLRRVVVTRYADFLPDKPSLPIHEAMQTPKVACKGAMELKEVLQNHEGGFTPPDIAMDDVCLLQFTSGTTGLPKGAMLTHKNQLFKSACQAQVYKYAPDDIMLTAMPIYHIAGMLWGMTTALYIGCSMALLARFDAKAMAMAISRKRCTKMYGTVSMNVDVLNLPDIASYDLTSMRINPCTSFGIFLTQEVADEWQKVTQGGVLVEAAYGLSETHTGDTFSPLDKPRIGSTGIPNYDTDIRIVDFDDPGKELDVDQVGEITVKSPAVFKGYWERPAETQEALRNGRLYTGDMGRFDKDGYMYFLGRKKEMIKSSGYAIAPEEVEGYLMRHPAVDQAACIPVPDARKEEVVKAFIVLNPDFVGQIADQDLIDWAREKMSAYKYPRFIEFVTELPKSTSGKLLRRILREREKSKL